MPNRYGCIEKKIIQGTACSDMLLQKLLSITQKIDKIARFEETKVFGKFFALADCTAAALGSLIPGAAAQDRMQLSAFPPQILTPITMTTSRCAGARRAASRRTHRSSWAARSSRSGTSRTRRSPGKHLKGARPNVPRYRQIRGGRGVQARTH